MVWPGGKTGAFILRTLTILGAVTMGLAGFSKFGGAAAVWQSRFLAWGYPSWSSQVVGGLEMLAAALLCVPRAAPYAACALVAVMLGVLYTVLTKGPDVGWRAALTQMIVMSAIAALRLRGRRATAPAGSALHGSNAGFIENQGTASKKALYKSLADDTGSPRGQVGYLFRTLPVIHILTCSIYAFR